MKHYLLVSLFIFLLSPTKSLATNYFVSPVGSDGNQGTSSSTWQTIQKAAHTTAPGDLVTVMPGDYSHEGIITITKSGTSSAPITYQGQGDNTIVQGFNITGASNTFKNFYITGSTDAGVVTTGQNTDLENIHAYNNANGGIILQIGSDGSKLIHNQLEHNAHFGIKVNSNDNLIQANEVWHTYYSTDTDGLYGFGANNIWDGNYVHDLSYDPAGKPHIDCFQTWGNLPGGIGISGTTIFENNRCIIPNSASSVDEATSGMTINDGGSGTLIIRNNVFDTYLGIGQYRNGSPNLNVQISNNTFVGHPFQSAQFSNTAIYLSYMNTIKQFTHNLVVGKNSPQLILINGSSLVGTDNWYYNSAQSVTFNGYNPNQDSLNVDPQLQADYLLSPGSPACNFGGSYVGAIPCGSQSPQPKPGDLNGDGHVDIFDYNILVSKFGNPYTIFDYNNLVANFGK